MAINPNTDFSTGQVLTAAQQNRFPRGVMSLVQNAGSGAVSLPAATNTTLLTAPAFTAVANRYYRITWQEPELNAGTGTIALKLQNGATVLMNKTYSGSPIYIAGIVTTVTTFSAGSVTITAIANPTTTGGAYRGSGGYVATLVIEDIGPA
jgi:hypothetical protein